MANIAITEICNLSCPYCFANEFVNKKGIEITIGDFQKALTFSLSSKQSKGHLGIIGGEPTIHSKFNEILSLLLHDNRVREATIFTNGIRLDQSFDLISDDKFALLINLNSPKITGESHYSKIINNLDVLINEYNKKHITMGINIYKTDQNIDYFIKTLNKFKLKSARLSITVENTIDKGTAFSRLISFKDIVYQLYVRLSYLGIQVIFDCNKLPNCAWSETEKKKITLFQANNHNERQGINLKYDLCNPVIDILPDLKAIRCFGLSKHSKVNISDFTNLDELTEYYTKNFDKPLSEIASTYECIKCNMFIDHQCYGGCLLNKLI